MEALVLFGFPPKFVYWIRACITTPLFSLKINGSLCGYFKGERGLRQGDPLSPYLFVIVIEILSLILAKETQVANFKFHWNTKQIGLSHLCFADDLLLFSHGDVESVKILKSCVDAFSRLSGLRINSSKSSLYLANVPEDQAVGIENITGFQRSFLPVKFLGLPLISSKLSFLDCRPLVQRLKQRIQTWTMRFLSFAGRLQLIQAVLFTIQSFWAAHFILPAAVVKEINGVFNRFLWKGDLSDYRGAKVAWTKVCLPYTEGGLKVKNLGDWNRALILSKLWQLVTPHSSSIWARWTRMYKLKNKHFWTMAIPPDCSWIWRKILKLRSVALEHISFRIGNGRSTSLWHDPWAGRPLVNPSLILNSGLGDSETVSSIICNGSWHLPSSNHQSVRDFRSDFNYSRHLNPNVEDEILWDSLGATQVTAAIIWDSVRYKRQHTSWHPVFWHKYIPPRYSFVLWLAFLHRLPTLDRISTFGTVLNPACVLCRTALETFDHLFFNCPYAFQFMFSVLRFCGWRGSTRSWVSITSFLSSTYASRMRGNIIKLGFAVVVYSIWQERNARLHENSAIPVRSRIRLSKNIIQSKLHSITRCQMWLHRVNQRLLLL